MHFIFISNITTTMDYLNSSRAICDFFDNYIKNIDDNYDENTYWKIHQKQLFIFEFVATTENNIFHETRMQFSSLTFFNCNYKEFKRVCGEHYQQYVRHQLVSYFMSSELFFELFKLLRKILIDNNVENIIDKIKLLCLKYPTQIKSDVIKNGVFNDEMFVRLKDVICKYALNSQIINIFNDHQMLGNEPELCKVTIWTLRGSHFVTMCFLIKKIKNYCFHITFFIELVIS